jgi:hypothetical protein
MTKKMRFLYRLFHNLVISLEELNESLRNLKQHFPEYEKLIFVQMHYI